MWGNTATTGNDVYVNFQTASANYSLFDPAQSNGTIVGSNNLNSDPLFTDADGADNVYGTEDDDLSLQLSSPCLGQCVFFRSQLFHDRSSRALVPAIPIAEPTNSFPPLLPYSLRHLLFPYQRIKRT